MSSRADFSGVWKIDKDKTDFGKVFPVYSAPFEIKIEQDNDSISVERSSNNSHGIAHAYKEKLSFDGNIVESMIKTTKKKANIQWSDEKGALIETAVYKDYNFNVEYKATEIWKVADNGKTLVIERKDEGSDGTDSRKLVYSKQ